MQLVTSNEPDDQIHVRNGYRVQTARIEFGGEFDGLWVQVKTRAPYRLIRALGDDEQIPDALSKLIVSHNLTDSETGDALPDDLTAEDVERIDFALVVRIIQQTVEAVRKAGKLPKS